MNAPMSPVNFSSTSLKFDLSMDARMGRKMAGLFGSGGLEIQNEGLICHARRHHYTTNLIAGGVVALVVLVLTSIAGNEHTRGSNGGFTMFAFILGAWLTSLVARFRAPQTLHVERASIERVLLRGAVVHLCTRHGDVQLTTDQHTYGRLLQTLQSWGIPAMTL